MTPVEVNPWVGFFSIMITTILAGAVAILFFRIRHQKAFLEITETKKLETRLRQEIADTEMEVKKDNNELKQKYLDRKLSYLKKNLEFFLVNDGNIVKLLDRLQGEFENEVKSRLQETKEAAVTKNLLITMGKERASHKMSRNSGKSSESDDDTYKEQYYKEKLRRLQDLASKQSKIIEEMMYYKEMFENIKKRTLPLQEINKKLTTSILEIMEDVKLTKDQKERMKQMVEKLRYVNNEMQINMDLMEKENIRLQNEKERLRRELAGFEQEARSKDLDSSYHDNELDEKLKDLKSQTTLSYEREKMLEKELEATKAELEATKAELETLQKTYLSLVKSFPGRIGV